MTNTDPNTNILRSIRAMLGLLTFAVVVRELAALILRGI